MISDDRAKEGSTEQERSYRGKVECTLCEWIVELGVHLHALIGY
jgi:hypothetical protein